MICFTSCLNPFDLTQEIIEKMVISMDGAMIKTYDDWKEVKSGVIYELEKRSDSLNCSNKSYISKIEYCHFFQKRIKQEARRRHYLDIKVLAVIGDGAR